MGANHVKAWRVHRGLTQAELGARIGTNGSMVSLLEAGERRLQSVWLRRLSKALGAPVGALMEHLPADGCADFMDAWAAVLDEDRPIALAALKTFTAASTCATLAPSQTWS